MKNLETAHLYDGGQTKRNTYMIPTICLHTYIHIYIFIYFRLYETICLYSMHLPPYLSLHIKNIYIDRYIYIKINILGKCPVTSACFHRFPSPFLHHGQISGKTKRLVGAVAIPHLTDARCGEGSFPWRCCADG